MLIIGMTGPIGHGKTTFAHALEELEPTTVHLESSLIIAEVADAWQAELATPIDPYDVDQINGWIKTLPTVLLQTIGFKTTFEALRLHTDEIDTHPVEYQKLILHAENIRRNPELMRHRITAENKEAYRPLLQWLGGYLVQRVDSGIWYNEIVKRLQDAERQGAQLCIVGGLRYPTDAAILRRAGGVIIKIYRPGHLQNDMLDPTERERDNIRVDCTVLGTGTVDDVARCAKAVLEDIKNDRLQKNYSTATS